MVAPDDKEDEEDDVGRGEEVREVDGPPVGEKLGQHCPTQWQMDCSSLADNQDWLAAERREKESRRSYFDN